MNTQFGTFEDLVAITNEPLRPIMRELRRVILQVDPNACEVVRLGDRAATYGVGPKKMSEGYCYILPYTSWVNLGFYRGAHLSHPKVLLKGSGKNMRHITLHSLEDASTPALPELIYSALLERRAALGIPPGNSVDG